MMQTEYDILMIATGNDIRLIENLMTSVEQNNTSLNVTMIIVNQGNESISKSDNLFKIEIIEKSGCMSKIKILNFKIVI